MRRELRAAGGICGPSFPIANGAIVARDRTTVRARLQRVEPEIGQAYVKLRW
jgi:hypothetical protein